MHWDKKVMGQRIGRVRVSKGETQEQLANAIGVTRDAVTKWETYKRTPKVIDLIAIATHYKVSADYLLGLKESKNPFEDLHPLIKKNSGFFDRLLAAEEEAKKNNEEYGLLRSIMEYVLFEKSEKLIGYGNHGDVSIVENEEAISTDNIEDGNSDMVSYIKMEDVFRYKKLKEIESELDFFRDFNEKHD